jgi:hypothetical protein
MRKASFFTTIPINVEFSANFLFYLLSIPVAMEVWLGIGGTRAPGEEDVMFLSTPFSSLIPYLFSISLQFYMFARAFRSSVVSRRIFYAWVDLVFSLFSFFFSFHFFFFFFFEPADFALGEMVLGIIMFGSCYLRFGERVLGGAELRCIRGEVEHWMQHAQQPCFGGFLWSCLIRLLLNVV